MSKKRVAVALSGGVDSSMTACLLKESGYDVIGITMHLWSDADQNCPSFASIEDAENTCRKLGIPFNLIDLESDFYHRVIEYFCNEYARGRTPNPCIVCNRDIKFGSLLKRAESLGADFLATGHYARVKRQDNRYHLLKGRDTTKDQSYMLYTLGQNKLRRVLYPLGDYTKSEIRELARQKDMPAAGKPSSQDICFIASDYGAFISQYITASPGDVVDGSGKILGGHRGTTYYTIGQRHGLGLATTEPLYVTCIDADKNRIIVGPKEELYRSRLMADQVNWISGTPPAQQLEVTVKIRYRSPDIAATLYPAMNSAEVSFEQPQPAITPGQAVVFYQDEEVIGGGTIES